ncbi:MAG: polysaccharide deacetylase family protein, partial [Clostridia bacterium]|nr:polysaccharide deacetylase family protein [Clostridia bacterium]
YTDNNRRLTFKINRADCYTRSKPYEQTVKVLSIPYLDFGEMLYTVRAGGTFDVDMICRNYENIEGELNAVLCMPDGTEITRTVFNSTTGTAKYDITVPTDWEFPLILTLKDDAGKYASTEVSVAVIDESKPGIRKVDRTGAVALSFDCGFENEYTQYILDTLDEYNAKATFFVTAMFVRGYPEMLKEIYARGHEIGNHTVNHLRLNELTVYDMYKEINTVNEEVEAVLGIRPTLMRPPYGAGGKTVAAVSRSTGCEVMYWTVDSYDWHNKYTAEMIIERSTEGVGDGYIILFHNSARRTKETLRTILDDYVAKGLDLVSVSELMYNENYIVDENGMQTLDPNYTMVTGGELFSEYTSNIDVNGIGELAVQPVFDDKQVIVSAQDAQTMQNDLSSVSVEVNIPEAPASTVSSGDVVGTMQFSYNGEVLFTADAQAVGGIRLYSAGEEFTASEPEDNNTLIYVIDIAAAAAIILSAYVLFIRKKKEA